MLRRSVTHNFGVHQHHEARVLKWQSPTPCPPPIQIQYTEVGPWNMPIQLVHYRILMQMVLEPHFEELLYCSFPNSFLIWRLKGCLFCHTGKIRLSHSQCFSLFSLSFSELNLLQKLVLYLSQEEEVTYQAFSNWQIT